MMTNPQINWASQHDWYAYDHEGMVYAWDLMAGMEPRIVKHESFEKMRDWAGY